MWREWDRNVARPTDSLAPLLRRTFSGMPVPTLEQLLRRIADGRTDLVWDLPASGDCTGLDDANRASLLRTCAYYGDVSALRLLLTRGARLDALGENFDLHGAAFHGHWRLCEYLVESGADVNHRLPDTGETALHAALCTDQRLAHDLVLRVLLRGGADPNIPTIAGVSTDGFMRDCRTRAETPLHRAAAFGSDDTIRMLISAGARIDARDTHGDTPLGWASWYTRPDSILRQLCYGEHHVRTGRATMAQDLLGTPYD